MQKARGVRAWRENSIVRKGGRKMKLNKEKFLKSELGGNLQECVTAWDH